MNTDKRFNIIQNRMHMENQEKDQNEFAGRDVLSQRNRDLKNKNKRDFSFYSSQKNIGQRMTQNQQKVKS